MKSWSMRSSRASSPAPASKACSPISFNEVKREDMAAFLDAGPLYLHVLGSSPRGRSFLAACRRGQNLPLMANFSRSLSPPQAHLRGRNVPVPPRRADARIRAARHAHLYPADAQLARGEQEPRFFRGNDFFRRKRPKATLSRWRKPPFALIQDNFKAAPPWGRGGCFRGGRACADRPRIPAACGR